MPATWHPYGVGQHPDAAKWHSRPGSEQGSQKPRSFNHEYLMAHRLSRSVTVAQLRAEAGLPPLSRQ